MGKPLFTLEDSFIDAATYGFDDDDTIGIFVDALEEGRIIIEESIISKAYSDPEWKSMAGDMVVAWDHDGIVVDYPPEYAEAIEAMEYGRPDVVMNPVIRQGLNQAIRPAIAAIEKALAS